MLHGWQRGVGIVTLFIYLCGTTTNQSAAAAVASSANFTVLAPTQRLADMVVGHADAFRSQIATEWLGGELPPASHPAAIYVELDPARSFARTLVDADQGRHLVWLVGSEEAITRHLLEHEVAHTVLAGRFGDRMPAWANEGIASRYDNSRRHQLRRQQLAGFVSIDSWPALERLLDRPIRQPWDYAAAVSLVDYLVKRPGLVQRRGQERFIEFVECSTDRGWTTALQEFYQIESVAELEAEWQRSVRLEVSGGENRAVIETGPAAVSARSFR